MLSFLWIIIGGAYQSNWKLMFNYYILIRIGAFKKQSISILLVHTITWCIARHMQGFSITKTEIGFMFQI